MSTGFDKPPYNLPFNQIFAGLDHAGADSAVRPPVEAVGPRIDGQHPHIPFASCHTSIYSRRIGS